MDEETNLTLSQIAEKYNVSRDTICRWVKQGIISYSVMPSGIKRYHYKPDVRQVEPPKAEDKRISIIYARVSTAKQTDDLRKQIALLEHNYPEHVLYSDVGSGLNYKRKALRKMVEQVLAGKVREIVVTYRDRLCRFSFELFEWLFARFGTRIVVLEEPDSSPEKELVDDLLAVITVFGARANGLRKYKSKIKSDPDLSFVSAKGETSPNVGDGEDGV